MTWKPVHSLTLFSRVSGSSINALFVLPAPASEAALKELEGRLSKSKKTERDFKVRADDLELKVQYHQSAVQDQESQKQELTEEINKRDEIIKKQAEVSACA